MTDLARPTPRLTSSRRHASWTRPRPIGATLLLLWSLAAFGSAAAGAVAEPPDGDAFVSVADARSTYGGTCGSSCDSGGSVDPDDEPDEPERVGQSYWVTTDRVLTSYDPGVSDLVEHLANYDDRPLTFTFQISERTMRSVGFSGGYADYFSLSVGGEVDRTRSRTVEKVIDPWEALKVYQRLETRRYTVYGTRYQDYDDGSRSVVGRSSGPYTSSVTKTGYVTYALR